jgi:two-component system, NarL family, sensor histidine kinase UhpB
MEHGFSLSSRVILINALLFALAVLALALSPATVSSPPVHSEVLILLEGLAVVTAANAVLVRAALVPLDRLIRQLDRVRSTDPIERVPVPDSGVAQGLAVAVNDLLGRIEAGQRESRAAALAAQESERSRIAQELHDGVGQSLTAIVLELGPLAQEASDPLATSLLGVREATRASLDEVRSVAHRLRPHVLEDLGLRSALAALTTDLFGPTPGVRVKRDVMRGPLEVDRTTELVLFRVAQEALTNVARHSGATTVELRLTSDGREVYLAVVDDGRGIDEGVDGSGLRGMRERAALVGGCLVVSGRNGGGTEVTLVVPTLTR